MKKILIIFIGLLIYLVDHNASCQIPFYDAIALQKKVEKVPNLPDADIVYEILKYYDEDNYLNKDSIRTRFKKNPFINFEHLEFYSVTKMIGSSKEIVPPPLGGLDVTTIADGLAKFMVERTKQELNAWFFEKFKDQMKDATELKVLFPTTSLHLEAIGSEIYNYNAYITVLRESFEQDLSALFINLPELLDHPDYKEIFNDIPEVRYILKTSLHIINQLNSNMHPGEIIHVFPPSFDADKAPANLYNGIRVVDLFSQSLRSKSKDRYWISQDSLKLLIDDKTFRIYLGLIYQQMDSDIVFKPKEGNIKDVIFKDEFAKIAGSVDDINKYRQFVQEFTRKAETAELALEKIRKTKREAGPVPKDIYAFMDASIGLIEYSTRIIELPYISNLIPDTTFILTREYIKVAETGANLYLSLSERNYGTAIINSIEIIDFAFNEMDFEKVAKKRIKYNEELISINTNTELTEKKKKNKRNELNQKKEKEVERLKNIRGHIVKYGTFMAALVNAENSDEVKTIIESVALPPGSFRTKRESKCNISLNSYLGFTGGRESITYRKENEPEEKKYKWSTNFALSAPVGISFAWGGNKNKISFSKTAEKCEFFGFMRKKTDKGKAHGIFLSVLDIGALASFRFADDESEVASTVELQNILAPGLFYTHSFRNAPISLLIGGQMGPLLRDVHTIADNIYYKAGFSFVVDIPILNFYNKPE